MRATPCAPRSKARFHDLAGYVATALRLSTSPAVFARLRGRMVSEVVSFDALRSSALFEAPEMRASANGLQRIIREFLVVLAIARALYVRLDVFKEDGGQAVEARLRPTLVAIAAQVERIAADPTIWRDPGQLRGESARGASGAGRRRGRTRGHGRDGCLRPARQRAVWS